MRLVLWSGGISSTYHIEQVLKTTNETFVTINVQPLNDPNRHERQKYIKQLHRHLIVKYGYFILLEMVHDGKWDSRVPLILAANPGVNVISDTQNYLEIPYTSLDEKFTKFVTSLQRLFPIFYIEYDLSREQMKKQTDIYHELPQTSQ